MEYVWILGEGPVVMDKQFLLDIERLPFVYLNNRLLPKNKYQASKELFHTGPLYYSFSKFGNQTMGNMAYACVQKIFSSEDYYISLEPYSMRIYLDSRENTVRGVMTICIFSLKEGCCVSRFLCTSMINLSTYHQHVKLIKSHFQNQNIRLRFF